MPTMKKTTSSGAILLAFAALTAACGPNQRIMQSANENTAAAANEHIASNSNAAPALGTFEQDLNAMRTADFRFIYVFRRKDGAPLNTDDKGYLSGTIPSEINRRRLSDAGRAVIIGSNFRLPPETLKAFADRFAFEDHSRPEIEGGNINSR
jgi:hypothetical protein